MARSAILTDMSGLTDPLQPWNFDFSIPNVPGGGSSQALLMRCQSATIPGHQNEDGMLQLRGSEITYAGRPLWEHNFQPSYVELRDMESRDALKNWTLFARDNRTSGTAGAYMANYKTTGYIYLYDDVGRTIRTLILRGLWAQGIQDAQLDSGSSGPVVVGASFRFDWHDEV